METNRQAAFISTVLWCPTGQQKYKIFLSVRATSQHRTPYLTLRLKCQTSINSQWTPASYYKFDNQHPRQWRINLSRDVVEKLP
jgi:hypothetical protein